MCISCIKHGTQVGLKLPLWKSFNLHDKSAVENPHTFCLQVNFQHVCTLDLHRPYIPVLLSFLPAWRISLCFCSDDPYLPFPLCASVSGVKSLIVSDSDGVFQFLLRSVSTPPKTQIHTASQYLLPRLSLSFLAKTSLRLFY